MTSIILMTLSLAAIVTTMIVASTVVKPTQTAQAQIVQTPAQGFHKSPEGMAHESEEGAIHSGVQSCLTAKRC